MNVYISDTHIGHANIIRFCERPFRDADHMDAVLMAALREADALGHAILHLGDFSFRADRVLQNAARHTIVVGNHDRTRPPQRRAAYEAFFGRLVGTERTWKRNTLIIEDEIDGRTVRLLLSHEPQQDLQGCDWNLYGHTHNNEERNPERFQREYPWLARNHVRHVNVCVEGIGYRPRTLAELLAIHARVHGPRA